MRLIKMYDVLLDELVILNWAIEIQLGAVVQDDCYEEWLFYR